MFSRVWGREDDDGLWWGRLMRGAMALTDGLGPGAGEGD